MQQPPAQVSAPKTHPLTAQAFVPRQDTAVFWLGSAGILVNSRGTLLMIDPVLALDSAQPNVSEAGRALLIDLPIQPQGVPHLDAVLFTHSDYDHLGPQTAQQLQQICDSYHGTAQAAQTLTSLGIAAEKIVTHTIGETFCINDIKITLTRADHSWQKSRPDLFDWWFGPEDCCGFVIETADGRMWAPGDSLLLEEHLQMQNIDLLFIDFSNDPYHFGTENAIKLANTLSTAQLIAYHYGTYDAPDKPAFNADPEQSRSKLTNPQRLHILAAGEPFVLAKTNDIATAAH